LDDVPTFLFVAFSSGALLSRAFCLDVTDNGMVGKGLHHDFCSFGDHDFTQLIATFC